MEAELSQTVNRLRGSLIARFATIPATKPYDVSHKDTRAEFITVCVDSAKTFVSLFWRTVEEEAFDPADRHAVRMLCDSGGPAWSGLFNEIKNLDLDIQKIVLRRLVKDAGEVAEEIMDEAHRDNWESIYSEVIIQSLWAQSKPRMDLLVKRKANSKNEAKQIIIDLKFRSKISNWTQKTTLSEVCNKYGQPYADQSLGPVSCQVLLYNDDFFQWTASKTRRPRVRQQAEQR